MCISFFFDVGHDEMGKGTKWSATFTTLAVEVEKCNSSSRNDHVIFGTDH
jgi:hypothetical protein